MKNRGKITLDNGIEVIYSRHPYKTISGSLAINHGSTVEVYGKRGLTHLVEHVCLEGSKKYNSRKKIDEAAADCGFRVNGATTNFYIDFPIHTLSKYFLSSLEIIADVVYNPLLKESDVEKQKNIILHELRDYKDSLDFQLNNFFLRNFFAGTPLEHPVIGYEEDIVKLARQDVKNLHRTYFHPTNSSFLIFGGFDKELFGSILKFLEKFSAGKKQEKIESPGLSLEVNKRVEEETPNIGQTYGKIIFNSAKRNQEHHSTACVLNSLFNGTGESSLFRKLRQDLGLIYNSFSSYEAKKNYGYFGINFSCSPDKTRNCVGELLNMLRNLNPGEYEIRRTKAYIETAKAFEDDAPVDSFTNFIEVEKYGLDDKSLHRNILAMNKKKVQDFVEEYLRGPRLILVMKPKK